ncbi:hypothetical protein K388_04842 [Streptomyces sp. KhCrAH-43]|nr:hypothetical protein K388_04842 [Streptomyces sp. KhCrAH-43]
MIDMRSVAGHVNLVEAPPGPYPTHHIGVNSMGIADQFKDKAKDLAGQAQDQAQDRQRQGQGRDRAKDATQQGRDRAKGAAQRAQDEASERFDR